jgi:hypothetical protein
MSSEQQLENDKDFKIGDFIEYASESYNGGTYRYQTYYNKGCIVSKGTYGFNVIKQYGGQIWCGVKPLNKISEEVFLSKFSIYDEFQNEILKHLNVLPTNMQNIIKNKIETKKLRLIHSMINYVLKNKFCRHRFGKIKIDDEAYALKWYIYNVLRMHEPHKIQSTTNYCYGATDLIQQFIKENTNFMVDMQFISESIEHIMILLIQEKWLEFLYEKSLIEPKIYLSRLFLISIKKLESKLILRTPITDKKISVFINKDKNIYEIKTNLTELIDTKIVFTNKYSKYISNKSSKCHKRYIINLYNKSSLGTENIIFEKISKLPSKCKSINKPDFIITNEIHLSYYINTQKNLIISHGKFTIGSCSCDKYNLYCLETKKLLGTFEFNINDYDFSSVYLEDISIVDEI